MARERNGKRTLRCLVAVDTLRDGRKVLLKFEPSKESAEHEHYICRSLKGSDIAPEVYDPPQYCETTKNYILTFEVGERMPLTLTLTLTLALTLTLTRRARAGRGQCFQAGHRP